MTDDRSTSARLAKATEQLSTLAHELRIAVSRPPGLRARHEVLASISARLSSQALDLAEINFAVAEDVVSTSGGSRAERSAATLGRISRIIEPAFEIASEVAAHLVLCEEQATREDGELRSIHLASLDQPLARLLAENGELVTGVGVAMAPEALADESLWMQWWVRGQDGPVQLRPQLDPRASRFYDYPSAVWFSESAHDLAPHLAPPHFDEGGTNAWMVTAALPVVVRGRFLGLACAELTLGRLWRLIGPALEAMPARAAVLSPEGVVVASTHPDLETGSQAPEALQPAAGQISGTFVELEPDVTMARSPALQWLLITDWREA